MRNVRKKMVDIIKQPNMTNFIKQYTIITKD